MHWLGAEFSKGWPSYSQIREQDSKNLNPSLSSKKEKNQKLKTTLKVSLALGTVGKTEERTLKQKLWNYYSFFGTCSRQEHDGMNWQTG